LKHGPRLFDNMRASCATDWAEALPAHVVAKWLGHSPLVAAKHYLQTRDAHFELATNGLTSKHSNPQTVWSRVPAQAGHTLA
jgi:integrase